MRNRLGKLGLMTMAAVLAVAVCGAAFASWTDELVVQGVVETGELDLVIEEISGTWVYKNLETGELLVEDEQLEGDQYLEVAKAWVEEYDVENDTAMMQFENVFPGPVFCADLLVHYYGVPGHVSVAEFIVEGPLEPYIWWEIVWPDGSTMSGPDNGISPDFVVTDDFYQLHECETFEVNICCQIPQDMSLRGVSSAVYMRLEAEQFNECTPDLAKGLVLPGELVHLTLEGPDSPTLDSFGDPRSYFDAYIDVPEALEAEFGWLEEGSNPNGSWPGWCCEFVEADTLELDVTLVSTIGMPDWEAINYLLNQPMYTLPPYNYDGIVTNIGGFAGIESHGARQRAFWSYQPVDPWMAADALALDLIADADANSAGFVPGTGQLAAVLCVAEIDETYQTLFIEVDP